MAGTLCQRGGIADTDQSPLDLNALEGLGIYDPSSPDADERREYFEWLHDQGFDVVELARTTAYEDFGASAAQLHLRPDARPLDSFDDLSVAPDKILAIARAFGFESATIEAGVTPDEIRTIHAAYTGSTLFSEVEVMYFARVAGAALARIGEAAVSLFVVDVEAPRERAGRSRSEIARESGDALAALDPVVEALAPLFRLHMAQAIGRIHRGAESASHLALRQAVGFVDLVGFTTISSSLSFVDLSVLVREFEAEAYEIVSSAGARVVKLVGDAVMLTAVEPDPVAAAASELVRRVGARANVEARGGLAYGEVISRGGDYYGPVVNLAARLGDLAVPGELLATKEFVSALTSELDFEPAGRRQLKGFAAPITTMSLELVGD